ncbi:hypothetical protein M378DRAFT_188917, partial [Amanita muscaria Koide BX008]
STCSHKQALKGNHSIRNKGSVSLPISAFEFCIVSLVFFALNLTTAFCEHCEPNHFHSYLRRLFFVPASLTLFKAWLSKCL